jgi:pyruvate/2-oxoacid:ferredoxin oxidoreductase alpha subunit
MKKVITGNSAVAYGVLLCQPKVVSAYPITPQTTIVEYLASFCADGSLNAKFINVESEHSVMSACISASATGVRVFTATSGHGLALMHEMLHVASFMRLPIVMAVVNRAMGLWNIHTDQNDSLSQRDTGWLQLYCEDNQEILDSIIQAYKISEKVLLPSMIVLEGFVSSHTSEIVDIPDISAVDSYLPEYKPEYMLSVENPHTFGAGPIYPEHYLEFRYKAQRSMEDALLVAKEVDKEFRETFSRSYGLVDKYRIDDAKLVLVTSGTAAGTARLVIDERRKRGEKVGMLKIRLFRPFPQEEVRTALGSKDKVAILDRNISFGQGGIFAQEVKSALCNLENRPVVHSFIAGLGGRDITPEIIHRVIDHTLIAERPDDIVWMGLKG